MTNRQPLGMERKEFAKKVGARIAHFRKLRGWTQEELGYKVSKEYQVISNIETGRFVINIHTAYEIAQALEVSLDALTEFD